MRYYITKDNYLHILKGRENGKMNEILAKDGGRPSKTKDFPKWPIYDEREIEYLKEVVVSQNWWRITGTKVKEFEKKFADFQGCEYCLGVTNGTNALQLALQVLDIGPGDEVIVPGMTFISTGLAVLNCNAKPVLVDIDKSNLCMDPDAFESAITSKTKAVIPVHMAGFSSSIERICDIARKYGIKVIEDAAHGHGGEYLGKRLGSYGDLSIFSFQNGKLMTCGEGGALVTSSKDYYEKALVIHDVGRPIGDTIYEHIYCGQNFRMNEFQAAILLAQIERVDEYNLLRHNNAQELDMLLKDIDGILPQSGEQNNNIITHYMYMFYYESKFFGDLSRNDFVEYLNAEGIPCCVCFPVMSDTEFYRNRRFCGRELKYVFDKEKNLKNSREAAEKVVWLHHRVLEGDYTDLVETRDAIIKIQNFFKK